jgi:hypothetical protein
MAAAMQERDGHARAKLLPMDFAALVYLCAVAAITMVFRQRVAHAPLLAGAHVGLAAAVLVLVRQHRRCPRRLWQWLRYWYPLVLVPAVFKLNGILVPQVNPRDLDAQLLAWDRTLFGEHPGVYLRWLESPWMTDVLRLCWMSYFVLPFVVAIPIYRRSFACGADPRAFAMTVFALTAGWYLSYLGYFVTPALGPGYFPDRVGMPPTGAAGTTDAMLSTLWRLEGERIRDICPSGHVIIAVLCLWIAFRLRLAVRWLLIPVVLGLVVGTVYLRFHYGVDVLAGLLVVGLVILVTVWLDPARREVSDAG